MSNSANDDEKKSEISKIKEAIYKYKKGETPSTKQPKTKPQAGKFLFKKPD